MFLRRDLRVPVGSPAAVPRSWCLTWGALAPKCSARQRGASSESVPFLAAGNLVLPEKRACEFCVFHSFRPSEGDTLLIIYQFCIFRLPSTQIRVTMMPRHVVLPRWDSHCCVRSPAPGAWPPLHARERLAGAHKVFTSSSQPAVKNRRARPGPVVFSMLRHA